MVEARTNNPIIVVPTVDRGFSKIIAMIFGILLSINILVHLIMFFVYPDIFRRVILLCISGGLIFYLVMIVLVNKIIDIYIPIFQFSKPQYDSQNGELLLLLYFDNPYESIYWEGLIDVTCNDLILPQSKFGFTLQGKGQFTRDIIFLLKPGMSEINDIRCFSVTVKLIHLNLFSTGSVQISF
jgi:hypothetical protein